jgi:hypothetical protein
MFLNCVFVLCVVGKTAPLFFRRVPWSNQLSCSKTWTFNPTLKCRNISLIAGRDSSLSSVSSSVLQWRDEDRIVWCRQFVSERLVAIAWSPEHNELIVFLTAMKGRMPIDQGVFAVSDDELLPVLFVARLNVTNGKILVTRSLVEGRGSFATPVGFARAENGSSVVHISTVSNIFHEECCVGPSPFVHTLVLSATELNLERECFDWACGAQKHCNMTDQTQPGFEPLFGENRLSGVSLAVVIVLLTGMMLVAFAGAMS